MSTRSKQIPQETIVVWPDQTLLKPFETPTTIREKIPFSEMKTNQENDPTCLSHSIARCFIHNFFKLYYTPWFIEWFTMLNTGSTTGNVPVDVTYTYDEICERNSSCAMTDDKKQKIFDKAGYLKVCLYLFIYFTCTEYYEKTKTSTTITSLNKIIPHIEQCVLHDILPENLLKHGQIITDFLNGRIRVDVKHMDHVEGYTDDKGTPIFENNIIQFDKSRFTTRHCWVQELGTIEEFVDRAMTPYPDTYFGIQIGKHIFNRGTPSDHAIVVSNYDSVNKTMMIRNSWDEIPYEQPLWRLKMSCWSPTFCTTKKWGFLYNVFYIGPTFTPYRKEVKRLATCSILGTCAVVGAVGLGTYFAMNRGGTKRKKKRKCTRKL